MGFIHDELVKEGFVVDYLCADDVPEAWGGRLAKFYFPWLVYRHGVRAARAGRPYDVINVHEPSGAIITKWRQAAGNPFVVVTSHGLEHRSWQLALEELRLGRDGPGLRTRLTHPVTSLWRSKLSLRLADHVCCLNTEDCEYLEGWLKRRRDTVTRVFPGVDGLYAEAAGGRDYTRQQRLLFAATWRKNKGIEDLVPAFAELAARYPFLSLTVLGAGLPEEVVHSAFSKELRRRVTCIQARSERETASAFASSDIFVLPSLFEGTPLTLLEAMGSALPIVTTATCGMKDVIEHDRTGLLIPIRSPSAIVSAVARLVDDSDLRARLGKAAQAQVLEKYSWTAAAGPVRAVYECAALARTRHAVSTMEMRRGVAELSL
jgi:glycosyltransferase involved in cell wall biosynthesis